jgi:hypothetical protein
MNTEPFAIFKSVNHVVNARFDLYTRWRFVFNLVIVSQNNNFTLSQNAQVTVIMRVLTCFKPFGYDHPFSVQSIAKIMFNARVSLKHSPALFSYLSKVVQVTCRPETRMLIALAVPAIVLIKSPAPRTCPTNSGNVYTSDACRVLVLVIKLVSPADPAVVTKLTEIVAADALMLVAVNLSMIAVTPVAVYWVVCEASAYLAGTRTLTVTINYSKSRILLGTYCIIIQFVPSETKVDWSPELASKIEVPAAPPPIFTTLLDADTSVCVW